MELDPENEEIRKIRAKEDALEPQNADEVIALSLIKKEFTDQDVEDKNRNELIAKAWEDKIEVIEKSGENSSDEGDEA